ncbi:site-specific DNA-methyltransferase [Rhodococcus sp. 05-2255-3B1]|nr:site-specific DNA-methyltransferase [Rhodococcus sp. 05-2255-3C]OZE16096.1 site-specific DNA-methyltransferase [Rhodococcus sp. 05-2255-3B1]OZE19136.1 site-specific DNA-methyltransferase [Rhodococcus sp. 05-2255-2A2]
MTYEDLINLVSEKSQRGVNISFVGKQQARRIARLVRPRVQRSDKTLSVGDAEAQSKNLLIEGDNLQALASLYRWRGSVDVIVTDPPYNTGNDFRYNDRWDDDPNDSGLGEWVPSDDPARHTKWMKFMYPRLQMMHSMLKPSGVMAICIDHRELFHLGQMMDEIFGESNRLAIINWQKSYSPRSDKSHVSTATEYILVYARDDDRASTALLPREIDMDARYQNRDGDSQIWKSGDLSAGKAAKNQPMVYAIQSPFTGELHYPPEGRCWSLARSSIRAALSEWGTEYTERDLHDDEIRARVAGVPADEVLKGVKALVMKKPARSKGRAEKILKDGPWPIVYFGVSGTGRPQHKRYLKNVQQGIVPMTYWADQDHDFPEALGSISWDHEQSGHSQTGVNELSAIVGRDHGFRTVKPLKLMQKVLQLWCPPEGLVLDPFAGSGTTGHAVLALNAAAGSDRRFILIEQGRPQRGDSYARTLTADRLQRVITGEWKNKKGVPLDGGFGFKSLTKRVDAKIVLQMEREEMVDTVIASHHDSNRRRGASLVTFNDPSFQYLVGTNSAGQGFYLIWGGPDGNTDLTEDVYEACVAEGRRAKLEPFYHVYARYNMFGTEDVRFYRIPDQILIDFGLDLRTEAYSDEVTS